ncbi:disintegrin and metalloproteinase domain-containing protein 33-like, partial [Perca fluviatilis]|uniref:disintegrin and metalloproteinase domain-containing protein 33-like n=1 Tax=Perca fluviatilis TaxID=8168 RepID=UPI001964E6B6
MNGATGGAAVLLLLLFYGRVAFTAARSLNAPRDRAVQPLDGQKDGTDSLTAAVTDELLQQTSSSSENNRKKRNVLDTSPSRKMCGQTPGVSLLDKTRPFFLVGGQRRSLAEALQDGHPDRLQCGLEVGGRLFLLDLEKNHDLLPKPPNVFYYLPNGTGVSVRGSPVTHCYYHGSVRGFPRSRVALSTCSGLRGIIAINSTLSFELQPQEDEHRPDDQQRDGGGGESG